MKIIEKFLLFLSSLAADENVMKTNQIPKMKKLLLEVFFIVLIKQVMMKTSYGEGKNILKYLLICLWNVCLEMNENVILFNGIDPRFYN